MDVGQFVLFVVHEIHIDDESIEHGYCWHLFNPTVFYAERLKAAAPLCGVGWLDLLCAAIFFFKLFYVINFFDVCRWWVVLYFLKEQTAYFKAISVK
jgi:hypothetical protein